jgi:acyl-CoA reductase-like NAD-dependent aldehyde dehydrogenase
MNDTLKTISPIDGRIYVERPLAGAADIDRALILAQSAQIAWGRLSLAARCAVLGKAVDAFVARAGDIAAEITWQMGRPISHSPGEVRGFEERSRYMLGVAAEALAPVTPAAKPGFERQIKRVPLGVIAVIAPWNYPYLTAVNAVLPAQIARNPGVGKQ